MNPVEYGAQTPRGVIDRLPGLDPALIDDVIAGCATPEKYLGFNVALSELRRTGGTHGLVTMCIGGGMGAAGILAREESPEAAIPPGGWWRTDIS